MAEGEIGGFVFAVVFILVFGALISSVPTGLLGTGGTAEYVSPIDPSIAVDFTDIENYTRTDFALLGASVYYYDYELGGYDWRSFYDSSPKTFSIGTKIVYWFLFLGQVDACKYISPNGINRGTTLSFDEINSDAEDGQVIYSLIFSGSGTSGGSFVFFWDDTLYSDSEDAWDNDELYLLHGIGLSDSAPVDIGSLLIAVLFLQLPDVPVLLGILIASPLWANIAYLLWYIIKETLPFV
jgi:hypothetical protein